MNVHLNSSVVIVGKAKEKSVHVLNLFVNTYPLLERELILRIMFEPQGVHDSGIQPSHYYYGSKNSSWPEYKNN